MRADLKPDTRNSADGATTHGQMPSAAFHDIPSAASPEGSAPGCIPHRQLPGAHKDLSHFAGLRGRWNEGDDQRVSSALFRALIVAAIGLILAAWIDASWTETNRIQIERRATQ